MKTEQEIKTYLKVALQIQEHPFEVLEGSAKGQAWLKGYISALRRILEITNWEKPGQVKTPC